MMDKSKRKKTAIIIDLPKKKSVSSMNDINRKLLEKVQVDFEKLLDQIDQSIQVKE